MNIPETKVFDYRISKQTISFYKLIPFLDHRSVTATAQKFFETHSKLRNGQ